MAVIASTMANAENSGKSRSLATLVRFMKMLTASAMATANARSSPCSQTDSAAATHSASSTMVRGEGILLEPCNIIDCQDGADLEHVADES